MDLAGILDRVERRLKAVELTASAAAKLAGKPDAIRNLQRAVEHGSRQGISTATLNALAPVLRTTPIWHLAAAGPEEPGGPDSDEAGLVPSSEATLRPAKLVRAVYGGVVEAGSFRPVDEFEQDPERPPLVEFADPEYPEVPIAIYDVAGDSMNNLKPRPILPGDKIVCLEFAALNERLRPRDGMVVVIEQTHGGGQLRERSVKQIEMYRDRTQFCPRSTNQKHKPIVVFHDKEADDGREVTLLAIVRRISSDVPMW